MSVPKDRYTLFGVPRMLTWGGYTQTCLPLAVLWTVLGPIYVTADQSMETLRSYGICYTKLLTLTVLWTLFGLAKKCPK